MNFKEFIKESFDKNTLQELKDLLKHHEEDAQKYKDSDESAYDAALKEIDEIKKAIAKLEKTKVPGNQDLDSSDSMDSAVLEKDLKTAIDIAYTNLADDFEKFLDLMKKSDKSTANSLNNKFMMITSDYDDFLNT